MPNLKHRLTETLRFWRALRLVWQSNRGLTILHMILLVSRSLLRVLVLYLIKTIVDKVSTSMAAGNLPTQSTFKEAALLIILAGVVSLLAISLRTVADFVRDAQGQMVADYMYNVLHAKAIEVHLGYYEDPQYQDILHRAQQEVSFRPNSIVTRISDIAQNAMMLLVVAGLLFTLHWVVSVVLFVSALPIVIIRLRYSNQVYEWQRRRTETERRGMYFHLMLTGIEHAKEIRLFNLGESFLNRFRVIREELRTERLEILKRRSVAEVFTGISVIALEFGSYVFMASQTLQGNITLGDFVLYFEAFRVGQQTLYGLLSSIAGLYEDNLFLNNLYEFLDVKADVREPVFPKRIPSPFTAGFVFENVSFQYPAANREALRDINLTIRPGETIALVGENGSGKTTLVKLLCRLYDPTAGRITLEGIDIRNFETRVLRRKLTVLFQDFTRYNLPIWENIWLGNTNAQPEDERIRTAANQAGVGELIDNLPNAYDTILGTWFEDGEELSAGEWQKVALARAYWREAPIIVLDEPTSAMDANSEHEVFENFSRLANNKTVILISHRLSTVKMADCIYVLDRGRIAESGTHEELMARKGSYSRMFEKQAQPYR